MRLVVAITGSSGVIYGTKTLEALYNLKIETHLVLSEWGEKNIKFETSNTIDYVKSLATRHYDINNMAAAISSGSFLTDGMIIVPCSMKTLSSIANGYDDNLISRAATVAIKESRKLVVVPRETPLSRIHLENMLKLSQIGAIVLPAMPGFYHKPNSIDDLIDHIFRKILDQFSIGQNMFRRWGNDSKEKTLKI